LTLRAAILLLCITSSILAQGAAASVPFVGCKSDGQVGPMDAPKGTNKSVPINPKTAEMLSYYQPAAGSGVLAPRGWYCFGLYGSGGESLVVSPRPIDEANVFSRDRTGPVIVVQHRLGETSGRFDVADIIARVFPAYKSFATNVKTEFDQPTNTYTFGPYPNDILYYKSDKVVEYKTPPQSEGLGTHSLLKKDASPIEGVAMLINLDSMLLSVRLPASQTALTPPIISQFERQTLHPDPQ
jgi:hypothetical protein